jgi:hypothetical protein
VCYIIAMTGHVVLLIVPQVHMSLLLTACLLRVLVVSEVKDGVLDKPDTRDPQPRRPATVLCAGRGVLVSASAQCTV